MVGLEPYGARYRFEKLYTALGDRLMVGQQPLELFIGVRIPVPERSVRCGFPATNFL